MEYESSCSNTYSGISTNGYEGNHADNAELLASEALSNPYGEFYSVGIDHTLGLKEKIIDVHGADSGQVDFINGLEDFLGDSDNYHKATQKFKGYVRNHINAPQNADYFVDEFVNSGYISAIERLCAPGSTATLDFCEDYAQSHGITTYESMLFSPKGTAKQAFSQWKKEEALRGQHRSSRRPENPSMAQVYDKAISNTYKLPEAESKGGDKKQIEISSDKSKLPEGLESRITEAFNRESQLYLGRGYMGTKRLSGDLPYRIVEAMVAELLAKGENSVCLNISKSELEKIIEETNSTGKDVFLALYDYTGKKDALEQVWNGARKILNDYAENLWQKRDTYRDVINKRKAKELPGSIYLNKGSYYWGPKYGEKAIPLVSDKTNHKLPGSLFKDKHGKYFWRIPHYKFKREMVDGQKGTTKNIKIAKKLQRQEWERIQKYEPELAAKISSIRKWGVTTKHKPTAIKIAKKLWKEIQENDPLIAARILSDKRSEKTRPDVDAVWPNWAEEKTRLSLMQNKPQTPIVYPKQGLREEYKYGLRVPEKLETMVDKIKNIDWMADNAMLVFDTNSPPALRNITTLSKGKDWADKQYEQNNRCLIQGCSSIDKETGRFKFTVYKPGFNSEKTLAEEVYHIVLEIIQEASPGTFKSIQTWHKKNTVDPTLNISEAFSQEMAKEELGYGSSLPQRVVKHARKIFSDKNEVEAEVIGKVKGRLSA